MGKISLPGPSQARGFASMALSGSWIPKKSRIQNSVKDQWRDDGGAFIKRSSGAAPKKSNPIPHPILPIFSGFLLLLSDFG